MKTITSSDAKQHGLRSKFGPTGLSSNVITMPLCFSSFPQQRVWGGRALGDVLNHALPSDEPYGESWDLSVLPAHVSRVEDGPLAGQSLACLWADYGPELVGNCGFSEEGFPLLIKWLECRDLLSVQVHPCDKMAREVLGEPRGKTEAWIVLEAEPTAQIMAGLKPGITYESFMRHLNNGTLNECLHSFTPRKGDCIPIPAGTVHAAGGGILIAEVQQSSDATFRLFDWNRPGLNGKPRPLQIDLALEALNWFQGPVNPILPESIECTQQGVVGEKLVDMSPFRLERFTLTNTWFPPHAGELTMWMVLDGEVRLAHSQFGDERFVSRGRTVMVPASAGKIAWTPSQQSGSATLLCVRLPKNTNAVTTF